MAKGRRAKDAANLKRMGRAIAELRRDQGMSQAALAAKADLWPSTIRRIERGETKPQWGTLRRIASALQIPLKAVVGSAEEHRQGNAHSASKAGKKR